MTGASRGIGRASAKLLAQRGDHVFLAARDRPALELLASELAAEGCKADVLTMDVTDDASVAAAIALLGSCDVVHAVEHAPDLYAASPVYRALLRAGRWFPAFMRARMHASVRSQLCARFETS